MKNNTIAHPLMQRLPWLLGILFELAAPGFLGAVTYTTKSDGNWNSTPTWESPGIPPNPLPVGDTVNILHNVTAIAEAVSINGTVNILNSKILKIHQSHTFTVNAGGTLNVTAGAKIEVQGTLISNDTLSLNSTGILTGNGMVDGDFFSNGIVNPGSTNNQGEPDSTACLTFFDKFTTTHGTVAINLGDTTACTRFDRIIVKDTAVLGGTLTVSLVESFVPSVGQSFVILTADSIVTGIFTTINLPVVPGIEWKIVYGSKTVTLLAQAAMSPPLPVELSGFTAQPALGGVRLAWRTASETGNQGFHVERSSSGLTWQKLAFVPGHGTTTEPHDYFFLDTGARPGNNYYRLQQLDFDGSTSYSPVEVVEINGGKPSMQAFPNPATSELNVLLSEAAALTIRDGTGRLLARKAALGSGPTSLNISDLPAGIYFLNARTDKGSETLKFSKK